MLKKYKKIGKVCFEMYSICSLYDYIDLLKNVNLNLKWFRGQNLAEYRLIPKGLRDTYAIKDRLGNDIEPYQISFCDDSRSHECVSLPVGAMVHEFITKNKSTIDYKVENNLQWECIAQHYGLPTRMLDWTTNPLDALFFAINDNKKFEKDSVEEACRDFECNGGFSNKGAAIFIIDPIEINKITIEFSKELKCEPCVLDTIKHYKFIEYRMNNLFPPVCINGIVNEKRICRQSGNFMAFGKYLLAFDYYNVFQNIMIKVFIPFSVCDNINKDLEALGITKDSIYLGKDEKEKIAKDIYDSAQREFYLKLKINNK